MTRRYSPEQVAAALEQARGDKQAAAQALGCTIDNIYHHLRRHASVRAAYQRAYEARIAAGDRPIPPLDAGNRPRFSPEAIATAIEQARGNKAAVCRIVGCSRPTLNKYMARHAPVRAAYQRACEARIALSDDWTESPGLRFGPQYPLEQMVAAIERTRGNQNAIARAMGCCSETVARYIERYPVVREAYRRAYDARMAAGDTRIPPPGAHGRLRFTRQEMAEAIRQARGLVSVAAKSLHCRPQTVLAYIRRFPSVGDAYEEERASMIDLVENRLAEAVDRGHWPAVVFVLSTLGADRGYTTKRTEAWPTPPPGGREDRALAEFAAILDEVNACYPGEPLAEGEGDEPGE